jgi:murein hydrolase activator
MTEGVQRRAKLAALFAGSLFFSLNLGSSQGRAASDAAPPAEQTQKSQLESIEKQLQGSEQQQRQMQTQIESIRADRARLTAALLATTAKTQSDEQRTADVEQNLANARASENAIRTSLNHRRGLIALVLAALQRMGQKPPPAVLVDPRDMLAAIRTSMLLGAVLPEMRQEIESLNSDLVDLMHARDAVAAEKAALQSDLAALATQRKQLSAEIDARQAAEDQAQRSLTDETAHAQELARQASDLKDLITNMERSGGAKQGEQLAAVPQDLSRVAPSRPFAQLRGAVQWPVAGSLIKDYGEPDGFGSVESGVSFATLPGAVVTAPADGWVAYSGPYRTYGQLLILNAGGGYYLVMAGMDRINVEVGQFVVAGEPVALMGDRSTKTAATIAVGAAQPVLYVEFRKDGATIDPDPWWVKPEMEKARG